MSNSRRRSTMKQPYVTALALAAPGSWTMHAALVPLGEVGPALCGTIDARPQGWMDPPEKVMEQELYCSQCMVVFAGLILDQDARLTMEDRNRYEKLREDYLRRVSSYNDREAGRSNT